MHAQGSRGYRWKEVFTNKNGEMYGRRGFTCTRVGHKIVVLGTTGALSFDSQNWGAVLNLNTRAWHRAPGFAFGLRLDGHSAALVEDKIYVFGLTYAMFGGMTRRSNELRTLDLVDTAWQNCTAYGQAPASTHGHSMDYLEELRLLVFVGGLTKVENTTVPVNLFNLESSTWLQPKSKGELPAPRFLHASCVAKDKVIITGGRSPTLPFFPLDDASIYVLSLAGQVMWQTVSVAERPMVSVKWMALTGAGRVIIFGANGRAPVLAEASFQGIRTDKEQEWSPIRCSGAPSLSEDVHEAVVGDVKGLWHLFGGVAPSANVYKIVPVSAD